MIFNFSKYRAKIASVFINLHLKFFKGIRIEDWVSFLNNSLLGSKYFISYLLKPKKLSDLHWDKSQFVSYEDVAIVVQGQLLEVNNFTIETLKIYSHYFSNSKIIFSTWDDLSDKDTEIISNLGVLIVKNKRPLYSGFSNINYQIVSTINGIRLAKELSLLKLKQAALHPQYKLLQHHRLHQQILQPH
jgi:hypothetical protein